jgi:phosphoribosylglycinamide formyltransferase-1
LLEASNRGEIPEVALVIANLPCRALERATSASVPTRLIPHQEFASREAFDRALVEAVHAAGADLICLAGFMRLLTPTLLDPFQGRVVNIHPSLLPAFPGLHAQRQALAAGVRLAGCSVHFVDAGTDSGALIAQAAVPIVAGDTEASLSERILAQEHRIYPAAVGWVARGSVRLEAGRVVADPELWTGAAAASALHSPPI